MLNGTPPGADVQFGDWHNESHPGDVDGDGYVAPSDALQIMEILGRFGSGTVAEVQRAWYGVDPIADELVGGFLPDANEDEFVSPLDALLVINRHISQTEAGSPGGSVAVLPDPQGRPMSVLYTADDGRTKQVDVNPEDSSVLWEGFDVYVTRPDGVPRVIAKPGAGILENVFLPDDTHAIVTRYMSDGSETVERYVCAPMLIVEPGDLELRFITIEPDDVRRPIVGFEEVLGALVSRQFRFDDGTMVVQQYQEATVQRLLSISATTPSGVTATVDMAGTVFSTRPDLTPVTDDLIFLLNQENQPPERLSLAELVEAVEKHGRASRIRLTLQSEVMEQRRLSVT